MEREKAFGRLLAIANIISENVYEPDRMKVSEKYLSVYLKNPGKYFYLIHKDLMEYSHKFGEVEMSLIKLFEDVISEMEIVDFEKGKLEDVALSYYYSEQNRINKKMRG